MPSLLLVAGPSVGFQLEFQNEATLGRSPSCEVPIPDDKVSRRHAKLLVRDGGVRVLDLRSRNGTRVNGKRIQGEVPLTPGDRIQVGDTVALFQSDQPSSEPKRRTPSWNEESSAAALYRLGLALLGAEGEATIVRRSLEECLRSLRADRVVASVESSLGMKLSRSMSRPEEVDRPQPMEAIHRIQMPLVCDDGKALGTIEMERSAELSPEGRRLAEHMGRLVGQALASLRAKPMPAKKLSELIAQTERLAISDALSKTGGKKVLAASLLGISRPTLDKKILKHGLTLKRKVT